MVFDGETRAALAVTRSLGRAGVDVQVLASTPTSLAGTSRYAAARAIVPDPNRDPAAFCTALEELAAAGEPMVWLPLTDASLTLVSSIRDRLGEAVLPFPDAVALGKAWDKWETLTAASAAGLATPDTVLLDSPEAVAQAEQSRSFPVVLKPRYSRWRAPDGSLRTGAVERIDRPEDLRVAWERLDAEIPSPLLQQFIPGAGMGVFALAERGRVVANFAHRRLREFPPGGGVSVLRESIEVPETLAKASASLLASLDWHGVAMIEFREDALDGTPYVMEINPRFWGSLQLAIDAGVDFPALLYRVAVGEPLGSVEPGRVGLRSRWLLGDLNHLWLRLRPNRGPSPLAPGSPGRLGAIVRFLNPCAGRPEVWRLSDLRPALHELRLYVKELLS
jgi:predicted ATP-grasp superfamily ATP-dependent carboligase